MQIHHSLPPFRIDLAILLIVAMAIGAAALWWRFRRAARPRHTRIDLIGRDEPE